MWRLWARLCCLCWCPFPSSTCHLLRQVFQRLWRHCAAPRLVCQLPHLQQLLLLFTLEGRLYNQILLVPNHPSTTPRPLSQAAATSPTRQLSQGEVNLGC